MPVNTTVSHVSPLISYIPRSAWSEGSSSDPNLGNYSLKSYHATNITEAGNASVVFSWWGTGVWVHGGYRRRLGGYTVTLDSDVTLHQGYVDGTDEDFDAVLFNATGLPAGPHQLRITNASNDVKRPVFDIDHLVFESNLEETETVSHMSADCTWFPKGDGAWEVDQRSHSTHDSLGAMGLAFTGAGFILYGQLDGTSAPLTVTLDGRSSHPVAPNTAITPLLSTSHVLFAVTDLNQGNHTIWVENNPADSNTTARRMDIAYGRILSLPNDSGFSHGGSIPAAPDPGISSSLSSRDTVILAASFGSFAFFFLCIIIWRVFLCIRRKIRRDRDVRTARPFLARTDTLSPSPSSPYPYQRAHRSQHSYARATSTLARRHGGGNSELMGEIDALQHSFSRLRRPGPVTVAIPRLQSQRNWNLDRNQPSLSKAAALEREDQDDDDYNDDLQFAPAESYSPGLQRRSTDATASSYTMYDSMSVNVPPSPASPPDILSLQSPSVTRPLRVGQTRTRRSSIEKPPRWQLVPVGSPVASTPSLGSRVLPSLPPPMVEYVYDEDMWPPPYRSLDMH